MESGFVSRIIEPLNVHEALSAALDKETNSTRIVELFESWTEFEKIETISSYARIKRPDAFKTKYESAKRDVEASRSLVPAQGLVEDAKSSNTLSVAFLIAEHGRSNIDNSSLAALKESFNTYYKAAALRLHPDKNPSDAEKFKTLGNHKAWVDSLTEATFAASAK